MRRGSPYVNAFGAVVTWIVATAGIPIGVLWLLRAPENSGGPLIQKGEVVLLVFIASATLTFDVFRARSHLVHRNGLVPSLLQIVHPLVTLALGIIYAAMTRPIGGRMEFMSDSGNATGSVAIQASTVDGFGGVTPRASAYGNAGESVSGSVVFGVQEYPTAYTIILIACASVAIYYKFMLELATEQDTRRVEHDTHPTS